MFQFGEIVRVERFNKLMTAVHTSSHFIILSSLSLHIRRLKCHRTGETESGEIPSPWRFITLVKLKLETFTPIEFQ